MFCPIATPIVVFNIKKLVLVINKGEGYRDSILPYS